MAWMKNGDNAATHPPLMSVMGAQGADERTLNEVAGFIWRLACQSANHTTDYLIDVGTAWMIGGARTDELLRLSVRAGLLQKVNVQGRGQCFAIVEDKDFIHIRLKSEIEWERQQRKDTRDPRIKAAVIHRDGDNCRWCGVGVHWTGAPSNRTGELDHLNRGRPGTVTSMVVACRGCNGGRGGPGADSLDTSQWDDSHALLPVPSAPNYGVWSSKYLTQHGYPTEPNYGAHLAPATAYGAEPAPQQRVRPATTPGAAPSGATSSPDSPRTVQDSRSVGTGLVGSGRVGSGLGRVGTGRDGAETAPPPPGPRPRRRGRRGGSRTRPSLSPAQQSQPQGETR